MTKALRAHALTLGCNGSSAVTKEDLATALELVADAIDGTADDAISDLRKELREEMQDGIEQLRNEVQHLDERICDL